MTTTEDFVNLATPEAMALYGPLLTEPNDDAPRWVAFQRHFLEAVDAYVDAEMVKAPDFEIASHEAGGQCRIWFPHYQVRGRADMMARMQAILDARLAWAAEHLFHGYVDCHEVHHEPETYLYFQLPLMHLTGNAKAVASVEDFAHHLGNWAEGVPDWYDWETHSFRSTWLGTREVRAFPPYDYQEANHFRFLAIGLGAYIWTGDTRYLTFAEDYAQRWCNHIEACAAKGEPIVCSILPEGAVRQEMGYGGRIKDNVSQGVYPTFYATVATNTTYDIVIVLLDLYRLTGTERYRAAVRAMLAQYFDNADAEGRPPSKFSNGAWVGSNNENTEDRLRVAMNGSNDLLVRMVEKYRAVSGDTSFDGAMLRWAETVDETSRISDQLQMSLLVAAHRLTGNARYLERACEMSIRGMAVTEANTRWHQCDSTLRYGFKYPADTVYNAILAGIDYATRGGLPMVGLTYRTGDRPGLPEGVAVRTWEPTPNQVMLEAINYGSAEAVWQISGNGSGGRLRDLVATGSGTVVPQGDGWQVKLPVGETMKLQGALEGRNRISPSDLIHGS